MRLKGAVITIDRYTAPATRAALSVGCIKSCLLCWLLRSNRSEWSAITTQSNCDSNEYHGNDQSKPKTRRAQVCAGGKLRGGDGMHLKRKGLWCESHQTVFHHRGEMRSPERDLLKKSDREKRHYCPKKSCATRPA